MSEGIMDLVYDYGNAEHRQDDELALYARKLLETKITALTAERDEWKARCEFSFEQRDKLNAQLKTLQYEVDAIPAIKAERDEYAACADTMAAAHKVERDGLARTLAEIETKVDALIVERDALKEAAKLALDALSEYGNPYNWDEDFHGIRRKWQEPKSNTPSAYNGFELAQPAIAALKAVL